MNFFAPPVVLIKFVTAYFSMLTIQVCAYTQPNASDAFGVCNPFQSTTSPNPAAGSNFYNGPDLHSVDVQFAKLAWITGLPGLFFPQ